MKFINEHSDAIFFYAENNGISYDYEDIEDVVFEKQIVDAVGGGGVDCDYLQS